MLEKYYDCERTIWRLQNCGVFGKEMESYASYLSEKQLAATTARVHIRSAAHLSRYALWEGVADLTGLDEAFAYKFINEHLPNCSCERVNRGKYTHTVYGVWHVLRYLGEKGIIPMPQRLIESSLEPMQYTIQKQKMEQRKSSTVKSVKKQKDAQPDRPCPPRTDLMSQKEIMGTLPESMGGIILQYDEYLNSMFGLSQKTRNIHRLKTMLFLKWVYDKHGLAFQLSDLCADDIIEFQEMCNAYGFSNDYRKTVTSCLRGFLRFLRWQRILEIDLCPAVYKIKAWKLASVPKYIPYETANMLLSVPDRNTVKGKRDYLALLLMLRLGLRANEVVQLELCDISLGQGHILVRRTKSSKERTLPISNEIAEAIADYLVARPSDLTEQRVILRSIPPFTPLVNPSALGGVVRRCILELGIQAPSFGTHLLRHTLNTHLVNNNVSFKEATDISGHASIETTGIYAKVQLERLKHIALPFPCLGEVCGQ